MIGPLNGLRVGLLTASASRLGGGVFEAVAAHAAMIRDMGGAVHVFALEDCFSHDDAPRFAGSPVTVLPVKGPQQIGFAPGMVRALLDADLDCLHLHGIWMYPSAAGAAWASRTGKPYFISPHGMLDPWITARGRWKKALARLGYERRGWSSAQALHALTLREARDISDETRRNDSVVIPNAGPDPIGTGTKAFPSPTMVYIGRIHPKKNLIALVQAWHGAVRPEGARLEIAGWGDPDDIALLQTVIAQGDGSARFLGPAFGAAKEALLARARFVVLPSHSEGLPMAILEAWAAGIPTVMTAECNLPEGFSAGAATECGRDVAAITAALDAAWELGAEEWQARSDAAIRLASDRFSPAAVSAAWATVYADTTENQRRGARLP